MLNKHFQYPGLSLQTAEAGDLDEIVALSRRAFAEAEAINGEPYTSRADLEQRAVKGYEVYAVSNGDYLVASFLVLPNDDEVVDALYFGRLAVDERWRGQGVGSAVVSAIIAHARELGRKRVVLNYQQNSATLQAYYERFGFVRQGEPMAWKKIMIVPMRLELK